MTRSFAMLTLLVAAAAQAKPVTDQEKALYAIGMTIAGQLNGLDLGDGELDLIVEGMRAKLGGTAEIDAMAYAQQIQQLVQARAERYARKMKERSAAYVAEQAKQPGAKKTESGALYFELQAGTGALPKPTDKVTVHYRGTLIDGSEFDSSYGRGKPATFPLNGVIKCWTEGVGLMKPGGKARLVCPSEIAYGEAGHPPTIPGGAALVFEVELLSVAQ